MARWFSNRGEILSLAVAALSLLSGLVPVASWPGELKRFASMGSALSAVCIFVSLVLAARFIFGSRAKIVSVEIPVGSIIELPATFRMRVECKEICPHSPADPGEEPISAVLDFHTRGSLVYGGSRTTKIRTNTYRLPLSRFEEKEPYSVYSNAFSASFVWCFSAHVDHIDQRKGTVALRACVVRMM